MLLWTIQWIFISLILIILLHHLYLFFKNTLTIPKVRDLVNKPTESYNEILDTIKSKHNNNIYNTPSNDSYQEAPLNDNAMQDELKNFLNELKKPKLDKQMNNNKFSNNSNNNSNTNNMFEAANDLSYSNAFSSY